jgi:hypothetical protein
VNTEKVEWDHLDQSYEKLRYITQR